LVGGFRRVNRAGSAYPPRLLTFASATIIVAVPMVAGALAVVVQSAPSAPTLAGVAVLFTLALVAELRPVPVDVEGDRLVSLAFVFVISAQMLFSWEWSVLVGGAAIGLALTIEHAPPLKLFFNTSVYAIAALLAAVPGHLLSGSRPSSLGYAELTALVFAAGAIFVLVNVTLVCLAISLASSTRFRAVLGDHFRHSGPAFLIMGFIAAQTVIFWNVSPFLVVLVSAPLFTLNLYQRSSVRGRAAQMAATTDSLTGLRNHRAFQDDLAEAVADAGNGGMPVALCLIDVDRFKQVNDRCGHPAGDAALRALANLLRSAAPGAYRLGGDEFAIMLRGSAEEAATIIGRIKDAYAAGVEGVSEPCTISGGIAVLPGHADDVASLKAHADLALYLSKRTGKNKVNVYQVDIGGGELLPDLGLGFGRDVRLRLAEKLIAVVDARDSYVGEHATAVADLVLAVGKLLGVGERELRHLYVAGLLHDLGKIGIPDAVLRKPGPLNAAEQALMRTHPRIGFDLLDGLDLSPVDTWILHHHENFDGSGYPFGIAGEEIPLGSRIILVADAFNAMTTRRSYRGPISEAEAVAELWAKAGSQFDPTVVAAMTTHLERRAAPALTVQAA
jgi:diguanylate cyclase (GGDEF)-like protein